MTTSAGTDGATGQTAEHCCGAVPGEDDEPVADGEVLRMQDTDGAMRLNKRRPGPFGPASDLLPIGQEPLTVHEDAPAWDALDRMRDANFSQLPVVDENGHVVGVFSWKSFALRTLDYRGQKVDACELTVSDCMEPPVFIPPDDYIDTNRATDWGEIDHILVGNREELLGVLTTADVFGRLTDFAEAFVLLYEIELDLRDLFQAVYSSDRLEQLFRELSPENAPPITALYDCTFGHYVQTISNRERWQNFEPVFRTPREAVSGDLKRCNDLRNAVFHFRRQIVPRDTDVLRRFRDRLRMRLNAYLRRNVPETTEPSPR